LQLQLQAFDLLPLCLHLLLLRFDLLKLGLEFVLLCRDYLVLLLQFVQQHGGEQLVLDRVGQTILVVGHHFGVDLRHFLGDKAVLQQVGSPVVLRLVEEGDRAQLEQLAAAVIHVEDLILKAARREAVASVLENRLSKQLSVRIDANVLPIHDCSKGTVVNPLDVSVSLNAQRPDEDLVAAGGLVGWPGITDLDVVADIDLVTTGDGSEKRIRIPVVVIAGLGPNIGIGTSVEVFVTNFLAQKRVKGAVYVLFAGNGSKKRIRSPLIVMRPDRSPTKVLSSPVVVASPVRKPTNVLLDVCAFGPEPSPI